MIKIINSFILIALFIAACNLSNTTTNQEESISTNDMTKPALTHTVFFWTTEDLDATGMAAFEKGLIALGKCPQILSYSWGPPAPTENRDVVDNTYSYAINVQFASLEDQAAYQTEPIHLKFIEDHKAKWAKVIVYDNLVK